MKICQSCNHENKDTSNFCEACGTKLVAAQKFCPQCGEKLDGTPNFCPKCGFNLAEGKANPETEAEYEESYENEEMYEDDESLKSEMKKVLPESFNLSEWKVCQNSEPDEKTTVEIENESLGIYTSVTLKKDSEFFKRIAALVYRTNEVIAKSTPEIPEPSSEDVSFLKEEIKNIAERTKGEIVKFGKHEWRVIDRWNEYTALLCTKSVATKMYDEVDNYLLTEFFENDFSPAEKENIVFKPEIDYDFDMWWLMSIPDGKKVFLLPQDIAKRLSLEEKQQSVDWWLSDGWIKSTGGCKSFQSSDFKNSANAKGVIPAIIVKTR